MDTIIIIEENARTPPPQEVATTLNNIRHNLDSVLSLLTLDGMELPDEDDQGEFKRLKTITNKLIATHNLTSESQLAYVQDYSIETYFELQELLSTVAAMQSIDQRSREEDPTLSQVDGVGDSQELSPSPPTGDDNVYPPQVESEPDRQVSGCAPPVFTKQINATSKFLQHNKSRLVSWLGEIKYELLRREENERDLAEMHANNVFLFHEHKKHGLSQFQLEMDSILFSKFGTPSLENKAANQAAMHTYLESYYKDNNPTLRKADFHKHAQDAITRAFIPSEKESARNSILFSGPTVVLNRHVHGDKNILEDEIERLKESKWTRVWCTVTGRKPHDWNKRKMERQLLKGHSINHKLFTFGEEVPLEVSDQTGQLDQNRVIPSNLSTEPGEPNNQPAPGVIETLEQC